MNKATYWVFGVLIVIFGGIMIWTQIDHANFKKEMEKERERYDRKLEALDKAAEKKKTTKHVAIGTPPGPPPGTAREGYVWEWHGDHWHEMQITQGETIEQTPIGGVPQLVEMQSDLPDEIPEKFPAEEELRQMDLDVLLHLARLYTKASNELGETDFEAGVRLYNATIPILYKIMDEKNDRIDAIMEEMEKEHRKEFPVPRIIPATEESSAVFINTKPPKKASDDGGKQ